MTLNQKASLLRRMQRMDWEMRTRHYPAVLESEPVERVQYIERQSEAECYGADYELSQMAPADSNFR